MERFKMYARKIRALTIGSTSKTPADDCIHQLLNISGIQPLFPALKTLDLFAHFEYNGIENNGYLFLIEGELLSKIKIREITSQNELLISVFLLHLADKAPALRDITLFGHLSLKTLGILKTFRRLQSVGLSFDTSESPIAATFFQDLHVLPDLQRLHVAIRGHGAVDRASIIREETEALQALESLDLWGPSISLWKILECIPKAPKLRTVGCHIFEDATPRRIQKCLVEICRVGRNVQNFTITGPNIFISADTNFNILGPFIECRQLSSLAMHTMNVPINDNSIRLLCENGTWQNLRTLQLPYPINGETGPSLTSLRVLAQNCPELTSVTIPIDLTLLTPSGLEQERSHPRTPGCQVQTLKILVVRANTGRELDSQAIELAIAVARFLEHYFPNLGHGLEFGGLKAFESYWAIKGEPVVNDDWTSMVKRSLIIYTSEMRPADNEQPSSLGQNTSPN